MFFHVLGMHENIVKIDLMEVTGQMGKGFLNHMGIDRGAVLQAEAHPDELPQTKRGAESLYSLEPGAIGTAWKAPALSSEENTADLANH